MSSKDEKKTTPEEINEINYEILEDCTTVMNPEMVRNYEEIEPCNDGTIKRDIK